MIKQFDYNEKITMECRALICALHPNGVISYELKNYHELVDRI